MEELQAGGVPAVLDLIKLTHGSVITDEFDVAVRAWIATVRAPLVHVLASAVRHRCHDLALHS